MCEYIRITRTHTLRAHRRRRRSRPLQPNRTHAHKRAYTNHTHPQTYKHNTHVRRTLGITKNAMLFSRSNSNSNHNAPPQSIAAVRLSLTVVLVFAFVVRPMDAAASPTLLAVELGSSAADPDGQQLPTSSSSSSPVRAPQINDRPIVGVLTQEVGWHLESKWPGQYSSYIAASYVKFIEGGGARVVPIWIGKPREYYEDIMNKINGVLIPGGATWFNATDGYADAGRHIYEIAVRQNDAGRAMPIWGTCLGMELLAFLTSNNGDPRAECSAQRLALHMEFMPNYRSSQLFGDMPKDIDTILGKEPVTAHFHNYCVTRQNITDFGMADTWRVLATNKDWNGFEFVSAMEHYRYPFFGVIFHPEKPVYEWVLNRNVPHSANAIRANQYFAMFFVNECRRSVNQFAGGVDEENSVLIYNYQTNFTALVKSAYQQCYMFDKEMEVVVPWTGGENDVNGSKQMVDDDDENDGILSSEV